MIHHVPPFLQPRHPIKYPGDNHIEFERWFFENFRPTKNLGRTYLPIFWTNYYCANGYGKDIKSLASYLATLPRDKKYFTIVQYDDGILNDLAGLDIRVYSMSGRPMDYPLPLICCPHDIIPAKDKLMLANFVGRNTHPIREKVLNIKGRGIYTSSAPHTMKRFCEVLSQSTFTLCPRGYGPTSFRIMEALQMGSIPVYISDRFIIPHGIPFDEYGVLIRPDQISDIPAILKDINPDDKKKDAFVKYYTYIANQNIIFDDLRHHSPI